LSIDIAVFLGGIRNIERAFLALRRHAQIISGLIRYDGADSHGLPDRRPDGDSGGAATLLPRENLL